MVGKRIEIHPAALAELKSAVEWYLERSEPAAREFVAEVDRAIALVIESPRRWPVCEHNTRKFVLRRFPFAVTYRERDSGVQILALAHGQPTTWVLDGTAVADKTVWWDEAKPGSPADEGIIVCLRGVRL